MSTPDPLRARLEAAHSEALRVHDSPVRADQLERTVRGLLSSLEGSTLAEEPRLRVRAALESAVRALRWDEDGREAARHLATALGQLDPRPRRPSPFLDEGD